jgi:hypothetical protein
MRILVTYGPSWAERRASPNGSAACSRSRASTSPSSQSTSRARWSATTPSWWAVDSTPDAGRGRPASSSSSTSRSCAAGPCGSSPAVPWTTPPPLPPSPHAAGRQAHQGRRRARHVTFGGRLAPDAQGFIASRMARKHSGDWRDAGAIRGFATEIAAKLALSAAEPPGAQDQGGWHGGRDFPRS